MNYERITKTLSVILWGAGFTWILFINWQIGVAMWLMYTAVLLERKA